MATWDQWMDAYDAAYRALPNEPAEAACPDCQAQALRLVLRESRSSRTGANAYFWCDACLQGVGVSPAPVPDGVAPQPADDDLTGIPNFRIVS